jgi:hypothetical protein
VPSMKLNLTLGLKNEFHNQNSENGSPTFIFIIILLVNVPIHFEQSHKPRFDYSFFCQPFLVPSTSPKRSLTVPESFF